MTMPKSLFLRYLLSLIISIFVLLSCKYNVKGYHQPCDDLVFCCFKKKVRCFIDDFIVRNDNLNLKEEELVKTSLDIFKKMDTAIFRRSWINTGLVDENEFNEEVDEFEEYDVASSLLEKEEEEELIEHFLGLQIEKDEAAAQMEVQEEAPFQIIEEKSSRAPANAPKKQLKITSFFK